MKQLGCTGALVLFFISAVVVSMFAEGGAQGDGGVTDTSERGHLALTLILQDLGFNPGKFEGSPKELAESDARLVILPRLPELDEDSEEGQGSFSPEWYSVFIEGGGDLVVPVSSWDDLNFLWDGLGVDDDIMDLSLGDRESDWQVRAPIAGGFSGGEDLTLQTDSVRFLTLGRKQTNKVESFPLVAGSVSKLGGVPVAVAIAPWGAGRLIALGAPRSFENELLVEADNALLFTRLIEYLQAGQDKPARPLFDQSSMLLGNEESWVGLLFKMPLVPATLAIILGLCFWAWSFSARRSFPLDRRLARRPPPSQRARALAGIASRAGHPEWLETPTDGLNHD